MAYLVFLPIADWIESATHLLYDGTIGTGGMVTVGEGTLKEIALAHGKQVATREIPKKVSEDQAYQNAKKNSDRQNARIEHDKALKRVITALFTDDAQLFKQFQDNESFRHWLTDTVFGITYEK